MKINCIKWFMIYSIMTVAFSFPQVGIWEWALTGHRRHSYIRVVQPFPHQETTSVGIRK